MEAGDLIFTNMLQFKLTFTVNEVSANKIYSNLQITKETIILMTSTVKVKTSFFLLKRDV